MKGINWGQSVNSELYPLFLHSNSDRLIFDATQCMQPLVGPSYAIVIIQKTLKCRSFFRLKAIFWYQNDSFKNLFLSYWLSGQRAASPEKQDFLRGAVRPIPGR